MKGGPLIGKPSTLDYNQHARFFAGMPEKTIHQTFKNTTQLGRVGAMKGLKLWKRHKAPNPALNTPRRNEPVATDTIYGAVPAVKNGSTAAQIFIGQISALCEAAALAPVTSSIQRHWLTTSGVTGLWIRLSATRPKLRSVRAVSYTHLTLPTIPLV